MQEVDPFLVFDGDLSTDSDDEKNCQSCDVIPQRDNESCGVMTFHPNTELSLLVHVRQSLISSKSSDYFSKSSQVLSAVDKFCLTRHWMMHVGPEKGAILLHELEHSIRIYRENSKKAPFLLVELGTYCGYSSILYARHLLSLAEKQYFEFRLITIEIDEENANIARQLIDLAGLSSFIEVIVSYSCTEVIENNIKHAEEFDGIDFLFIDHDKESYLSDFKVFESLDCFCKGSKVVADNVLFAGISDYISFMKTQQSLGKLLTTTRECKVEYSSVEDKKYSDTNVLNDGIEVSIFQL